MAGQEQDKTKARVAVRIIQRIAEEHVSRFFITAQATDTVVRMTATGALREDEGFAFTADYDITKYASPERDAQKIYNQFDSLAIHVCSTRNEKLSLARPTSDK